MSIVKAKVVLLGDGSVGKTSLVKRVVLDQFSDDYLMTVGTKVSKKELTVLDGGEVTPVVMMVWDVLGQKGYAGVQESAVKDAQGVVLTFDLTRDETWKSLEEYWIPIVWRLAGRVPMVFAGNKMDLADDPTYAHELVSYLEQKYEGRGFPCSAKSGENVERLFSALAEEIVRRPLEATDRVEQPTPPQRPAESTLAVTDRIMTDFCAGFGGLETGMAVVRQQFERAGVDVRAPTKDGLLRVIDLLSDVEEAVKARETVTENRLRRISWVRLLP